MQISKEFCKLGTEITKWYGSKLEMCWPQVVFHNNRWFYLTDFAGTEALFSWDEEKEQYLHWDLGDPLFDWADSPLNNADSYEPLRYNTLEDLVKYVETGV